MSLFLISSCDTQKPITQIKFTPYFNTQVLDCKNTFKHNQQDWQTSQIQFYLHNIQYKDAQNQWHKVFPLVADNASKEILLIGGVCNDSFNWQISSHSSLKHEQIRGIKFTVGVPHSLNHLNPLTQPSPLNQSDMFWTWQLGHKFLRIELTSNSSDWIFHLGSTGCSSPSPVRAPKSMCKNPNLVEVILPDYTSQHHIAIDIAKLIKQIDLVEKNNCQSSLETPSCRILLPRIGVNSTSQIFEVKK